MHCSMQVENLALYMLFHCIVAKHIKRRLPLVHPTELVGQAHESRISYKVKNAHNIHSNY